VTTIPLQTLEELDLSAEEFEALVLAGMENAVQRVLDSDDIEEALAQADQSALDVIIAFWAVYVAETLVPALDDQMAAAGLSVLTKLIEATGNPLLLIIDQPLDTQIYLQQARNRLVAIGDELWFRAREQLAEGVALGESVPKLAARVRAAVGVAQPRANVIARTETHTARTSTAMATMQRFETAYGIGPGVMRKQWQATNDPRTRPTHHEADGQSVPFNEPFMVGGFPGMYPGDPVLPPQEGIQCRCTPLAIFDPADLNLDDNGTVVTLTAATEPEEHAVPWHISEDSAECAEGQFAVVKDATGEVEGCHDTREEAADQMAALYASESDDNPDAGRYVAVSGPIVRGGGRKTGDSREFVVDALQWQDEGATAASLEIPLGYQYERSHSGTNDKTARVGRIDAIERQGDELFARGVIDLKAPWGPEAATLMGTRENPGILAGVSIIIDKNPDMPGLSVEYQFAEGCDVDSEDADMDPACAEPERVIVTDGARIRGVDLVDIPAYAEARMYLDAELPEDVDASIPVAETLTASSYTITIPELPPAEWFEEPKEVPKIGAITVTDDGRFFGYVAPRHVAHRGIRDKRVTVPTGNVDYGIWMNRATLVDDGKGGYTKIATGPITMDCGHAPMSNRVVGAARREHYDNACSVVATARVGENSRGVWIAGALIPGVSPKQVAQMMACQLSGDWGPHREKPGKRELAAALLVPVPGFPTAQHSFTLQGGELAHTATPVRFGRYAGVDEPIGMKAAVERLASQVGRDRKSRLDAFAADLHSILKGN